MIDVILSRTNQLATVLTADDEAVLVTNEINVGYFTGFQHSEGCFLMTNKKSVLFVDFRYYEAAQKYSHCCSVVCFTNLLADVSKVLKELGIQHLYLESTDITLFKYKKFSEFFEKNGVDCFTSDSLDKKINAIRIVKDKDECSKIQTAQNIAEKSYTEVLNYIKPGVTERKIALELEYLMKKNGAQCASFDLITITGQKTSLPHGFPSEDKICSGDFFTMDFGAVYDGYHSDTTRTVAVEHVSDKQAEIYDIVLTAQLAALDCIKSGVKCSFVDSTARRIIDSAVYKDCFGHSTGHGVGLQIH